MLDIDAEELRRIIKEELEESHKCRFSVTDEQASELGAYLTQIKELGEGSLGHGMQEVQDNHRFTKKQRRFRDRVANRVGGVVIGVLTLGLCWSVWDWAVAFLVERMAGK